MKKIIYWLFPALMRADKILTGLEENHIALIRLLDDYQKQNIALKRDLKESQERAVKLHNANREKAEIIRKATKPQ